jgi:DNA-directed RNA polymerase specialized sigma24 family protein
MEERHLCVEHVLGKRLSLQEQTLVRERFWQGRSVEEIAHSEHKSSSWVYKSFARIFDQLRVPLGALAKGSL